MRKLRKFVVKNAFREFLPQRSDFEIVEEPIPDLKSGEFLLEAEYISVDPYMRSFAHNFKVPYEQFGFQVGRVVESKHLEYPVDSHVVYHAGWRTYSVLSGALDEVFHMKPYVVEQCEFPLSLYIGALGMPGITAYLGLIEICKPKKGDVLCVTSAAGAVGSLVGQIAKIKGCTTVGFAGSDEKLQFLQHELGFDHVFNYKTVENVEATVKEAVGGVDCYFDNVGGELAAEIMKCMNPKGRVALCGSISTYGNKGSRIKSKDSIKPVSFSFTQWDPTEQRDALRQLKEWLQNGTIKAKETVTNGFEELPDAFVSMLRGRNIALAPNVIVFNEHISTGL